MVAVGDEEAFQEELVLLDDANDRRSFPAGVEQGRLPALRVPGEKAVDGVAALAGADLAQFAPAGQGRWLGLPAPGNGFEFGRMQADESRQRLKVRRSGAVAAGFQNLNFAVAAGDYWN